MKKHFPLLVIGLTLTSLAFTGIAFLGLENTYARYDYHYEKDGPLLTLVMRGMADDISPLEALFPSPETEEPVYTAYTSSVMSSTEDISVITDIAESDASQNTGADTDSSQEITAPEGTGSTGESTSSEAPVETPSEAPGETPPAEPEPGTDTPGEDDQTPATPPADPGTETPPPQQPVAPAAGTPADDSYYSDALFIGDSRTVGLSQYAPGLDAYATFYCKTSLNIFNVLTSKMVQMEDGEQTVETALSRRQFGKIYICLGINEIGYAADSFISTYTDVLNRIRALQPTATIYVQGIMHVSAAKQAENPVFNNAAVNERNGRLAALTNGADLIYIDINYLLDDENGALSSSYTFDGVHLTADSYSLWYQEIKEQTK